MGETGIFTSSSNQMLGSMSGLIGILQVFVIVIGVMFFLTSIMNMMRGQQIDIGGLISNFFISALIIGLGVSGPDLLLKTLNPNSQSTIAEQKVEKEKELSGEEKLKKLNAYRRSNQRDIFLVDEATANQYLNYLKFKNLDEVALKY